MIKFLEKLSWYTWLLWLFLCTWQTRYIWHDVFVDGFRYEYGVVSVYAVDLLLLFVGGVIGIRYLLSTKQLTNSQGVKRYGDFWRYYFIVAAVLIVLAMQATDILMAMYWVARYMLGGVLLFIMQELAREKQFWQKSFSFLLLGILLQAGIGNMQFDMQSDIFGAQSWLGVSAHNPSEPGVSVVEVGRTRWLRAYGLLPHPNILGGILGMGMLLSLLWYLKSIETMAQYEAKFESKKSEQYTLPAFLALLSFVIFLHAVLLTFSRSAWLGIAGACITVIVLSGRLVKQTAMGLFGLGILIVASYAVANHVYESNESLFVNRVTVESRLENKSIDERVSYINEAKELIVANRVIGVGLGNYTKALMEKDGYAKAVYEYQPVHSLYYLLVAELGILAWGFFLCVCAVVVLLLKKVWYTPSWYDLYLIGILVLIGIIGLFDHYWWTQPIGWYVLFMWLGVYVLTRDMQTEK